MNPRGSTYNSLKWKWKQGLRCSAVVEHRPGMLDLSSALQDRQMNERKNEQTQNREIPNGWIPKQRQHPNTAEDLELQERSFIISRDAKWYSHLEEFGSSVQNKHTLSMWSNNHNPLYLSKWNEKCPHNILCMDVSGSFTSNRQKYEATKLFFNG